MALVNKPFFKDKKTSNKIALHLSDINDQITENDIANVKTDVTPNSDEADIEAEIEAANILSKKLQEDKDREDGNNSNDIESSWDVLK